MKDYILNFEGYWRDCNKGGLPTYKGVYLVYRCNYNVQNDTVNLIEIIYIGQAENIHDRHIRHEKSKYLKASCRMVKNFAFPVQRSNRIWTWWKML